LNLRGGSYKITFQNHNPWSNPRFDRGVEFWWFKPVTAPFTLNPIREQLVIKIGKLSSNNLVHPVGGGIRVLFGFIKGHTPHAAYVLPLITRVGVHFKHGTDEITNDWGVSVSQPKSESFFLQLPQWSNITRQCNS
jgi:hypothetical protein